MQPRKSNPWFGKVRYRAVRVVFAAFLGLAIGPVFAGVVSPGDVVIADNGKSDFVIVVADDATWSDDPGKKGIARNEATYRRWLGESVLDLQRIIEFLTGSKLAIGRGTPAVGHKAIYIGAAAEEVFGPVGKTAPDKQACRIVVENDRIGLYGESPLASVYAIYGFLQGVGCRWYIPGEIGECLPDLPQRKLAVRKQDTVDAPATVFRGIWYADDAYRRRNRLRQQFDRVDGSHALEGYITAEQRSAHPSWCALLDNKRDPARKQLAWGNPEVSDAIAEKILSNLWKNPVSSVSLSPLDQIRFSQGPEDTALDAGVWDETMQTTAITDRLINFANRIVAKVKPEFPSTRFGLLAYVQYVKPPAREKPDPAIVPLIAPITYNRVHSLRDDRIESSRTLRALVEGWGKLAPVAFRGYAFNLAEPMAPFPQIDRYSKDLPFLIENNTRYWQTETFPNFESSMHGLYLSTQLTWDPRQDAAGIVKELSERFYGLAAQPMDEYWRLWDNAWSESTNLAGAAYGYLDRFPKPMLEKAGGLLDQAKNLAVKEPYAARVQLARDSFDLFVEFTGMIRALQDGSLKGLDVRAENYRRQIEALRTKYGQYFFSDKFALRYFDRFWQKPFSEAGVVGRNEIISRLESFSMAPDAAGDGKKRGWSEPGFTEDKSWQKTKVGLEQWNQKGFMNYFGPMWYRAKCDLSGWTPTVPQAQTRLWISLFDDEISVFVNGKPTPLLTKGAEKVYTARGFATPATFDVTGLLEPGKENQITFRTMRNRINEMGTGGLLAPVYLYVE